MKLLTIVATLFSLSAFADFPQNNLRIGVDSKNTNGMTEEKFNKIIGQVEAIYAPIVKEKKGALMFDRQWATDTVNAGARRLGKVWMISMFGGLARHPLVTDDGFMMVVCHELGHHIGGAPKKGGLTGYWASTEGEADYFAATKCMKRVLADDNNLEIAASMEVDNYLKMKCEGIYSHPKEVALCERIGMAGKSLASLLGSLSGAVNLEFDTPDLTVVEKSNPNHPQAQCRLDTYFQGNLCTKDFKVELGDKNPAIGACTKKEGFEYGMRPLCWYKPSRAEQ